MIEHYNKISKLIFLSDFYSAYKSNQPVQPDPDLLVSIVVGPSHDHYNNQEFLIRKFDILLQCWASIHPNIEYQGFHLSTQLHDT